MKIELAVCTVNREVWQRIADSQSRHLFFLLICNSVLSGGLSRVHTSRRRGTVNGKEQVCSHIYLASNWCYYVCTDVMTIPIESIGFTLSPMDTIRYYLGTWHTMGGAHGFHVEIRLNVENDNRLNFVMSAEIPRTKITLTVCIYNNLESDRSWYRSKKSTMPGLTIGDAIPNLEVESTYGKIKLLDYIGFSWAIVFSHPGLFRSSGRSNIYYIFHSLITHLASLIIDRSIYIE